MTEIKQHVQRAINDANHKIMGESLIALGVGAITSLIVFGVMFWLSWFAFTTFFHSFRVGSASTTALVITGVFALVAIFSAWRRHDPFSNVQAMDDNVQSMQLGLGYAMGVPIVNRQSAAGIASLLIGGPANIMDSMALWRTRIRGSSASIEAAAQALSQSAKGVPVSMIADRSAIAILHRLGLVKVVNEQNKLIVRSTVKGSEIVAKASQRAAR